MYIPSRKPRQDAQMCHTPSPFGHVTDSHTVSLFGLVFLTFCDRCVGLTCTIHRHDRIPNSIDFKGLDRDESPLLLIVRDQRRFVLQ